MSTTSLSWMLRGACGTADPEEFFPEGSMPADEAKRVCGGCEVAGPCRDFALAHPELEGIWGGLTGQERRSLSRPSDAPRLCRNDLHPMTPENTYTYPNGVKSCRACRAASNDRREPRRHDGKPCGTRRTA